MPKSNEHLERLEQAFGQVRSELDRLGSTRDEVERRIAATSIKNGMKNPVAGAVGIVVLVALVAFARWHVRTIAPLPGGSIVRPSPIAIEQSSADVGGAELTDYLAAVLDQGAVVVIWSYRGQGIAAMPTTSIDYPAGKYRCSTLRQRKSADGRTVVCSLLMPDAGVQPMLEPPSILVRSAGSNVIALSVWPRAASAAELIDAIRSAAGDGNAGFSAADILQQIQKRSPQRQPSLGKDPL